MIHWIMPLKQLHDPLCINSERYTSTGTRTYCMRTHIWARYEEVSIVSEKWLRSHAQECYMFINFIWFLPGWGPLRQVGRTRFDPISCPSGRSGLHHRQMRWRPTPMRAMPRNWWSETPSLELQEAVKQAHWEEVAEVWKSWDQYGLVMICDNPQDTWKCFKMLCTC